MAECWLSDEDFWTVLGECSQHGKYMYRVKHHEKAVGCPECSVNSLEYQLKQAQAEMERLQTQLKYAISECAKLERDRNDRLKQLDEESDISRRYRQALEEIKQTYGHVQIHEIARKALEGSEWK